MATRFSRALARNLRDARRSCRETFLRECGILFENMGFDPGVTRRSYRAHEGWDGRRAKILPGDFSLRDLYANLVTWKSNGDPVGYEYIESNFIEGQGDLLEADAVDHAAFSNIVGQIEFTSVLQGFNQPAFIGDRLVRVVPTDIQEEEKVPGISHIGDESEQVGETEKYPEVGVSEEWVTTPEKIKHGFICSLTVEAVRGDKTGILIQRCQNGALMMGINREKEILDVVTGVSTLYRRNGGAAQATYGNTHTEGDFDNLDSITLQDWTDIEAALLLFDAMVDPNTGEPIILGQTQVLVPSALLHTARRILSATEIREVTNTNTTSVSPNPLTGGGLEAAGRGSSYEVLSNQYVYNRTSSTTGWYIGDFQQAFEERENWPITTAEQRESSDAAFERDIVLRFKTSRKARVGVVEPRFVVEANS